jgi:hypothetical protein
MKVILTRIATLAGTLFMPFLFVMLAAQPTTWKGVEHKGQPWVKNVSRPYSITKGLEGRHLAVWASHGRFYDISKGRWRWQRPPLYTTCEDLFTQTIVVPYLMPMLENAGAIVFSPRERDWQRNEVIVDNEHTAPYYYEDNIQKEWMEAPAPGFAMHEGFYHDGENPFLAGTARMVETTSNKNRFCMATYQPNIPEAGSYAVYVSYQTVEGSVDDAHYTVYHQGQKTEFRVNQRMGGSTWVYLGTFQFDAGCNDENCVILTNQSQHTGIVTTDAVRFGGGMGNIERGGDVSHMPRCLEGARYYAQWAGMPYSIYSSKNGENDYGDDINARSLMLNELCGGSVYAPDSAGRNVPLELSLAIHSDAGYNKPNGDGIYGSLAICTTGFGNPLLASGHSRDMSRELASDLLDNTTADLRFNYNSWVPRELYDRNYSETRMPFVPSAILETLSHQNFTDMRYGLDPNFRFTLARSIYKTLLKFITRKHQKDYIVAPLTPHNFNIKFTKPGSNEVRISWTPTSDPQEPTANPTSYVLYTAEGDGGFDNGMVIKGTAITTKLRSGTLVHFRVAAVNKGGISFPTQVLSACFSSKKSENILVVDGFHRLASPAVNGHGFDLEKDAGVSYGRTCGFIGRQRVFSSARLGIEDSTGLGYSSHEMEGHFIGGNDFNYVRTHAKAISEAGKYNIVSCSSDAISNMPLYQYDLIDLALGLECDDGYSLYSYKAFPQDMCNAISQFTAQGGRVMASGAYLGRDMKSDDELNFLSEVLKCQLSGIYRDSRETVKGLGTTFDFHHQLCEQHYAATSCDVLMPATEEAFCSMLYADGTSAATAYKGKDYRTFVMGFPWECIKDEEQRFSVMQGILDFLLK